MLITGNITEQQMFNAGLSMMFITGQIGVPQTTDKKPQIIYKDLIDLTEDDFDKIELYFKNERKNETP